MNKNSTPRVFGWLISFFLGFSSACLVFIFFAPDILSKWGWGPIDVKVVPKKKSFTIKKVESFIDTARIPEEQGKGLEKDLEKVEVLVHKDSESGPAAQEVPQPDSIPVIKNPVPLPADPATDDHTEVVRPEQKKVYTRKIARIDRLTTDPGIDWQPAVSKDGNLLTFSSQMDDGDGVNDFDIYIRDLVNGQLTKVVENTSHDYSPVFSADDSQIAFSTIISKGNEDIFILNLNSLKKKNITKSPYKEMMPVFSPDGSKIVYVSNKYGNYDIFIIDIDGANSFQLTQSPEDEREPYFAPDGKFLVFTRIIKKFKESDIMLLPLEPLGKPINLNPEPGRAWIPSFSTDGKEIFYTFSSQRNRRNHLYRMEREGRNKELIKLFENKAQEFYSRYVHKSGQLFFHAERRYNGISNKDIFRVQFAEKK
ncbi:hypothetical protein ACFL35_11400 [Candidatus Riflebacteria bacterium]